MIEAPPLEEVDMPTLDQGGSKDECHMYAIVGAYVALCGYKGPVMDHNWAVWDGGRVCVVCGRVICPACRQMARVSLDTGIMP